MQQHQHGHVHSARFSAVGISVTGWSAQNKRTASGVRAHERTRRGSIAQRQEGG
jgi:hypothetical protein